MKGCVLLGLVDVLVRILLVPSLTLSAAHSVVHLPSVVLSITRDAHLCKRTQGAVLLPKNKPQAPVRCCIHFSRECSGRTIFALGNVAAFVASLWVCGVAPRSDPVPIWIPAVVQLQAVSGCGGPSGTAEEAEF